MQSHVQNSKRLVEEMLQNGATILVDMSGQRERLKVSSGTYIAFAVCFLFARHLVRNQAGPDSFATANKNVLQSAHRKMLDTLNSVGLSDSLLRVIERRQLLDKVIVYGGMVGS